MADEKSALAKALASEHLAVDVLHGDMFIGNMARLELAGPPPNIEAVQTAIREQEAVKVVYQERWPSPSACHDCDQLFRSRYLSTFWQNTHCTIMTTADSWILVIGNEKTHGGIATMDALLYEKDVLRQHGKSPSSAVLLVAGNSSDD
ncbi:hypothetical protein HOY80DRAFT_1000458 [Tuber brumale]|nr:hypothetical protein HOY80DRAFT_1000458 [Tuber brumale]